MKGYNPTPFYLVTRLIITQQKWILMFLVKFAGHDRNGVFVALGTARDRGGSFLIRRPGERG